MSSSIRTMRRPRRSARVAAAIAALLASVPPGAAAQDVRPVDPVLNPGDAVRIDVWEMPEMSGEFEVDAEGRLFHPQYAAVTVTGVPFSVVKSRLGAIVEQRRGGVRLIARPMLRAAVAGQVASPTINRYPPETTIGQVIALAGGLTEQGAADRVRLLRGDSVTVLDLRDPTAAALRTPVRSGDRIIVDRRGRTFGSYVMPVISVLGTVASIANLIDRRSRR